MELTQLIFTLLALVSAASGFLQNRQPRSRYFQRQQQRGSPKISVVTNLSQGPGRRPGPPARSQQPGINHRFSVQSQPHIPNAIRIVSDIILHPRTNQASNTQQRHQAPGQPITGQGQGQGRRGQIGQGRRGGKRQPRPYNPFNRFGGSRRGLPVNNNGNVHGHGHRFPSMPTRANFPGARRSGSHSRGTGRQSGHASLSQLTIPVINRTDLLALLKNSPNSNSTSGTGQAGGAAQYVLIPDTPNNRALVLSADPAAGRGFGSGAVIVSGGSNVIPSTQKPTSVTGFVSVSTMKPGEDPPEIEHPSA